MKPEIQGEVNRQGELFKRELDELVPKNHPLRLLADKLEWERLEEEFSQLYCSNNGRPGVSVRMLIGLLMLKYIGNVSDDRAVEYLSESVVWQYFCGLRYFECKKYCDEATLVRFRQRIGEAGVTILLEETVRLGKRERLLVEEDVQRVHVDTTVQEKHITYPHDIKHLAKVHQKLLKGLRKKKFL